MLKKLGFEKKEDKKAGDTYLSSGTKVTNLTDAQKKDLARKATDTSNKPVGKGTPQKGKEVST